MTILCAHYNTLCEIGHKQGIQKFIEHRDHRGHRVYKSRSGLRLNYWQQEDNKDVTQFPSRNQYNLLHNALDMKQNGQLRVRAGRL